MYLPTNDKRQSEKIIDEIDDRQNSPGRWVAIEGVPQLRVPIEHFPIQHSPSPGNLSMLLTIHQTEASRHNNTVDRKGKELLL